MKVLNAVLDLLFPHKCPFCEKVQDTPGVCPACLNTLPWTDEAHAVRILRGGLRCAAPLWYENSVRECIQRYKFRNGISAAPPLGEMMAQTAAERFSGEFDVVTWVPISARRLRKRGYDQSLLLAENACRLWDTAPERLLRKIRDNRAQSSLTGAAQRWENTRDAYQTVGDAAGRRVLLLDDVCTTGATFFSAAGTLLEAGAKSVVCAAAGFARLEGDENRGEKAKE